MEFTTYPLDDIDYSAEDAELFHCARSSGIYAGDDFAFSVTGADNIITLGPGIAWIRNAKFKGKVIALKEDTQIDMGIPDATYPRYDVLAIRFSANGNGTTAVVKNGTPASTPAIPAITQTEAVYELYICAVLREVGATSITAKDVTDLRLNPAYCGLMANSITSIDTSAIDAQFASLVENLRSEIAAVKAGTAYVMKSGDVMTGNLTVPTPTEPGHAVNREYVDTVTVSLTLTAAGWAGDAAPFSQTVAVAGLTDDKTAHIYPEFSGTREEKMAIMEACCCVSYAESDGETITFYCLEDRPEADISIRVEVGV